jgi:hypothetical protein
VKDMGGKRVGGREGGGGGRKEKRRRKSKLERARIEAP